MRIETGDSFWGAPSASNGGADGHEHMAGRPGEQCFSLQDGKIKRPGQGLGNLARRSGTMDERDLNRTVAKNGRSVDQGESKRGNCTGDRSGTMTMVEEATKLVVAAGRSGPTRFGLWRRRLCAAHAPLSQCCLSVKSLASACRVPKRVYGRESPTLSYILTYFRTRAPLHLNRQVLF